MSDIKQLFDQAVRSSQKRQFYNGVLGDGAGNLVVSDAAGNIKQDYVWCRISFGGKPISVRPVRCVKSSQTYDLPVLLQPNIYDELEVIGLDPEQGKFAVGERGMEVGPHGWTHSIAGPDPLLIDQRQVLGGAVIPNINAPDFEVTVTQFFYDYQDTMYSVDEQNLDLSSYVPATNQTFVIIAFDITTGTVSVVESGVTGTGLMTGGVVRNYIPFTNSDIIGVDLGTKRGLAAVRLYAGQTEIYWVDIFKDLRIWGFDEASALQGGRPVMMWLGI